MIRTISIFYKSIYEAAVRRFRSEELFFGLSAILTIIINYDSDVPAIFVICLLAFYYLFFGWFMFSVPNEKHLLFSIISEIVYSACLLSMAILIAGGFYEFFFYALQVILIIPLFLVLRSKRNWGVYKQNHFVRIGIVVLLNLFIYCFK